MLGIYIHIPFCQQKCKYCAFSSFVLTEQEQEKYIQKLLDDINNFHKKYPQEKYKMIDTVYIGGGTPSLLSIENLEKIISAIKSNFLLAKNYEWTIECNPNSISEEKLKFYKESGINRLSIGVQSLDNEALKFAGRIHDSDMAINSIILAAKYFDNISCDLLIGLQGMTKDKFIFQLEKLVSLGVKHISAYMLQIEEGTPLKKMVDDKKVNLPDDEQSIEIYQETYKFLSDKGFERYEVSNFALKGYESRHNLKYWAGDEYVGFGLSAHSYIEGQRLSCADRLSLYYNDEGGFIEKLTEKELIEEHIMLRLRCKLGIDKNYLLSKGYDITKNINYAVFIEKGVIIPSKDDNKVFINPQYYGVNNYVISSLLPD